MQPQAHPDSSAVYRLRTGAPPRRTLRGFKLCTAFNGQVHPMFVGARVPLPRGVWLDAVSGPLATPSKSGQLRVKSRLGALALRPGWHGSDVPLATHIGIKNAEGDVYARRPYEVWLEVEFAADVNYQEEVDRRKRHDFRELPVDGFYRCKLSPHMTGTWIVSGSMRLLRVMTETEVNATLRRHKLEPMPWLHGPLKLRDLGLNSRRIALP